MANWKQPPIAKIYEALGAIADGRVTLLSETTATVGSSCGDKAYTVEWAGDLSWITSNDNASFWQGYLGYPIIAVLLIKGQLSYNRKISDSLKGIPWKALNTRYRNNYEKTLNEVLAQVDHLGDLRTSIIAECERLQMELAKLQIGRPSKVRKPPIGRKSALGGTNCSQGDLL